VSKTQNQEGGIRIGSPDIDPAIATHVCGVPGGNQPGRYAKAPGHLPDGRSTARRSTGIDPKHSDPIMPEMPGLSPA
jgi:hypothetical protein